MVGKILTPLEWKFVYRVTVCVYENKIRMGDNSRIQLDEDTRLMLKVTRNDLSAFNNLYNKYFPVLVNYLGSLGERHILADDLAQEALIRLWQNRKKFRADSTVKTYLFGIARNVWLDEHRSLAKRAITQNRFLQHWLANFDISSESETEAYWTKLAELTKEVKQAIPKLTTNQQQAIRLFYTDGMTLQEAAKVAGCSMEAFESRLRRARRRLCQILDHLSYKKDTFFVALPLLLQKTSDVTH